MDNNLNNGWGNEQKVKDTGSFVKGIATGVTIMFAVFVIILVGNILLTKDYIETDDKKQMLQNGGFDNDGNTIGGNSSNSASEISDELKKIFNKAEIIQDIIDKYYYYEQDADKLADGIYSGMLDALGDPYSVYYNEEAYNSMIESN